MAARRVTQLCDSRCEERQCVYRVPIFSHLNAEEMEKVGALVRRKIYPPKTTVLSVGDAISGLYILRYGSLKLVRYSPEGNEVIVEMMRAGDFYGGDSMFNDAVSQEEAITLEETGVCFIQEDDLLQMIRQNPEIAIKILQVLSAMHSEDRTLLSILGEKDAGKRLSLFLIRETELNPEVPLYLTREDIAKRINLTVETVSRKISQLRKEGFVETKGYGTIKVKNREALQRQLNIDLNQRK